MSGVGEFANAISVRSAQPPVRFNDFRRHRARLLLAAAVACAPARVAHAAPGLYYQHAGGGDWNSAIDPYVAWHFDASGNFATANVPPPGDDAFIYQSGTNGITNGTVTFNFAYAGTNGIGTLLLGSGNGIFQSDIFSRLVAQMESIGTTGSGVYTQINGVNSLAGAALPQLLIASSVGSTGTYSLSTGVVSNPNGYISVGEQGSGQFFEGSGLVTASRLFVGNQISGIVEAQGTYHLDGGSLSVSDTEFIGNFGIGHFLNNGGQNTTTALQLAANPGSVGSYSVSNAGSLHVSGDAIVGVSGQGSLSLSSGSASVQVDGTLFIAKNAGSLGHVDLNAGTLSINAMELSTGGAAFSQLAGSTFNFASVNQKAGNASFGDNLYLAKGSGTTANYTLQGGNVTVGGSAYIGYAGSGTFTQSGGINSIAKNFPNGLFLGYTNGASGVYTLSAGTLSAAGYDFDVGYNGNGVYNQLGGSASANYFQVGYKAGAGGTVNLSGGLLSVSIGTFLAFSSGGTFNHSGGTFATGGLTIAWDPGVAGVYNMSNGATLLPLGFTTLGVNGNGTFNQSGGSVSFATNTGTMLFLGL
jgi:T5SS/PEP-CTERM-associated repeat protein